MDRVECVANDCGEIKRACIYSAGRIVYNTDHVKAKRIGLVGLISRGFSEAPTIALRQ